MLVDGGVRTGGGPMRQLGGIGPGSMDRAKWGQNGALLNRYAGAAAIPHTSGLPVGYLHPRSWSMPLKPGGMACRALGGTGELESAMQAGFPAAASLVGTGTLSADAQAVAALLAQLLWSGQLTADASLAAQVAAQLLGSGQLTGDLTAASALAAVLQGSGTLAGVLTAEAFMLAALVGTGTLTADPSAPASMSAILGVAEGVTPDSIAAAVWAHGQAVSLIDAVTLIRQISDNRLEVDLVGQRLVLFDDDGTTELRAWALETDAGEDVATAPGVQTKRGVPT